jgi:hypothetical protein
MTAPQVATTEDLTGQLAVLAAELETLGFTAMTYPSRTPPCLKVTNPRFGQLSEVIYAATARDGGAWFWWSWAERIDEIANTEGVASRIARVLST